MNLTVVSMSYTLLDLNRKIQILIVKYITYIFIQYIFIQYIFIQYIFIQYLFSYYKTLRDIFIFIFVLTIELSFDIVLICLDIFLSNKQSISAICATYCLL